MKMHMETRNGSQRFGVNLRLISLKTLVTYACLMHDGNGLVFNFIHTAICVRAMHSMGECVEKLTTHTLALAQAHTHKMRC